MQSRINPEFVASDQSNKSSYQTRFRTPNIHVGYEFDDLFRVRERSVESLRNESERPDAQIESRSRQRSQGVEMM